MKYDRNEVSELLEYAIKYLAKKNQFYSRLNTWSSMLNIILSSSIPILISLAERGKETLLIVSIFSAGITLLQTFKSTFHLNEKIQDTTAAILYFRKEQLLFNSQTAPYDSADDAENVHALVSDLATQTDSVISSFLEDN